MSQMADFVWRCKNSIKTAQATFHFKQDLASVNCMLIAGDAREC